MLVDFAKAGLCNPTLSNKLCKAFSNLNIWHFKVRLDLDSKLSENLQLILAMCRQNDKISTLLYLCRILVSRQQKTIVFCATMKYVEYISSIFREAELDCAFLYSQLDPVARNDNINR
jgi:superfamily II DNA/RNA helicase